MIVIYILFVQQTGSFATMRRLTKELQEQRKLATDQEASRLTDVKADFEKNGKSGWKSRNRFCLRPNSA